MSTMAEVGRQVIHVLRYPDKRVEYPFGDETHVYDMPEFFLATDEVMTQSGVHGRPIALGIVELPANAYVTQTRIDVRRPAGFAGSIPGAIDFLDTYLNNMFQVAAASLLDLAADPYYSELLGLKLVANNRDPK